MDSILEAKEVQIERKRFHFEFRENERGKFLRITEEAHGRRNTIIVPGSGLSDFRGDRRRSRRRRPRPDGLIRRSPRRVR
jgi:PurA ssDNA and RNA-binding protein